MGEDYPIPGVIETAPFLEGRQQIRVNISLNVSKLFLLQVSSEIFIDTREFPMYMLFFPLIIYSLSPGNSK